MLAPLRERFARAWRLLRLPLAGPLLIAASGGADSAAALVLVREIAPHAKIIACYVDHGLRPRASIMRDVAAVRAQARAAGASTVVRRIARGHAIAGSPEERARIARYDALAAAARKSGAAVVITGHQQDDLAETSLLALVRGTGIDGVAAMRPLRPLADGVTLARPLMWATKAQCRELLHELAIPVSQDETNDDVAIPRNAVRTLVASLERALPGSSRAIARSAALLADDKALLDRMSKAAWQSARSDDALHLSTAALRRMPVALVRRVIRHAVAMSGAGLRDFSYEHCDAIAVAIHARRGGSYHAGQATVVLSAGKLVVEREQPRSADPFEPVSIDLAVLPRRVATPLGQATFARAQRQAGRAHAHLAAGAPVSARAGRRTPGAGRTTTSGAPPPPLRLDLKALRQGGPVEIRLPREGDTCVPSGRTRAVSLARFLGKAGVPKGRRGTTPLLCAGGRIAAALGLRVMEPFKPKGNGPTLELGWRPADR